jgi:hypothetical protein
MEYFERHIKVIRKMADDEPLEEPESPLEPKPVEKDEKPQS